MKLEKLKKRLDKRRPMTIDCLTCAGTGTIDVDRNLTGPCPDCAGRGFHDANDLD